MKKVLVTGATGFIGDYVIRELLRRGVTVIASSADSAKASGRDWFGELKYIPFDFRSFDPAINYYKFFDSPDLMIHLAWEGLPNYKSDFHVEENLPRHLALLGNMVKHDLRDLTVTGTCFEYGMQEGSLNEEMPAEPMNQYGRAKNSLRIGLQEMQRDNDLVLKWLRLFYMYGKGQNPNSLLSQLDRALDNKEAVFNMSGGEQVRDFLPVERVAEIIVEVALQQNVNGIINCCSGEPQTVKDFVEDYLKKKNKSIKLNLGYYPYADYEPMRFWGDTRKLKKALQHE